MTSLELKNIAYGVISAHGLAWFSHFTIEKNMPATFLNPIYSFFGDCVMYYEILKGKHKIF